MSASDFQWIDSRADDPQDLCLHGHVTVQIGDAVLEDFGTVSATALYLLKTLTEDKIMSYFDIQMIPCCGHSLFADDELTNVTIIGCDKGTDWSVIHEGGSVRLMLPSGQEETVDFADYRTEVLRFADQVEAFYKASTPKVLPENEGYMVFWDEWHRRYTEAVVTDALATGREVELRHGGVHYFISRDSDTAWYLYCEETREKQIFSSADELYARARFGDLLLRDELARLMYVK